MPQLTEVAIYCRTKPFSFPHSLSFTPYDGPVYLKPLLNITMNVSTANQVGIAKLTNITCAYLKSLCGRAIYDEKECSAVSYHKPYETCGGMNGPLDYCDPIVAKADLPISKYTYSGIIFLTDAEDTICSKSAEIPLTISFGSVNKCKPAHHTDGYQACCKEAINVQLLGYENASAVEISYRAKPEVTLWPFAFGPFGIQSSEISSKIFLTLYIDVHTAKSGFKFAQLSDEYSCDSLVAKISDPNLYSKAECEELYTDHTLDIHHWKLFLNLCDPIEAHVSLGHDPVLILDASKTICNLGRFPVSRNIYFTEEFLHAEEDEASGIIAKALMTEIEAAGKTLGVNNSN